MVYSSILVLWLKVIDTYIACFVLSFRFTLVIRERERTKDFSNERIN
jgi:hypothetical protein